MTTRRNLKFSLFLERVLYCTSEVLNIIVLAGASHMIFPITTLQLANFNLNLPLVTWLQRPTQKQTKPTYQSFMKTSDPDKPQLLISYWILQLVDSCLKVIRIHEALEWVSIASITTLVRVMIFVENHFSRQRIESGFRLLNQGDNMNILFLWNEFFSTQLKTKTFN